MIPTLDDVMNGFPARRFLINIKSNDPSEGEKLATVLNGLPAKRRADMVVYTGGLPIDAIGQLVPDIRTASRGRLKIRLLDYIAYGWSGVVPDACRNAMVLVPVNIALWLWGGLTVFSAG
jgi:glycerophosphoryl diester phosphodiesterase